MTFTMRTLACASALALAAPALAQQGTGMDATSGTGQDEAALLGQTWQDVSTPSIRFIQRDSRGNVVFDSNGAASAPGTGDPALDRQIEAADGATPGATDGASPAAAAPQQGQSMASGTAGNGMTEMGAQDGAGTQGNALAAQTMNAVENAPSEQRQDLAASPVPNRMDGTAAQAAAGQGTEAPATGDATAGGMMAAGVGVDGTADEDARGNIAMPSPSTMAEVDDSPAPETDGRYGETARAPGPLTGPSSGVGAIGDTGGTQQMARDGASGQPVTDGDSMMAAIEGVQPDGSFQTADGMSFDIDSFAREMFEQGYRRGYVSGLTEMRTRAVRQLQGERDAFAQQRAAFERQADEQRRAMEDVLGQQDANRSPQMQRQGDGSTIIMLPAGMTPQQFLEGLAAQRR